MDYDKYQELRKALPSIEDKETRGLVTSYLELENALELASRYVDSITEKETKANRRVFYPRSTANQIKEFHKTTSKKLYLLLSVIRDMPTKNANRS